MLRQKGSFDCARVPLAPLRMTVGERCCVTSVRGRGRGGTQDRFYGGIHRADPKRREDAHDQSQSGERPEGAALAQIEIGQRIVHGIVYGPVEDALVHPEHVAGTPDNAGGGENSPERNLEEGAAEDEEFTDEAIHQWQRNRRKSNEHEERCESRHGRGKPAEFGDLVGVAAVVDDAGEHE